MTSVGPATTVLYDEKLRVPLRDSLWRLPVTLASWSMILTVGLIALIGVVILSL